MMDHDPVTAEEGDDTGSKKPNGTKNKRKRSKKPSSDKSTVCYLNHHFCMKIRVTNTRFKGLTLSLHYIFNTTCFREFQDTSGI